jgi:hypothetical protein
VDPKTTQTTTIPGRGGIERELFNLLAEVARQAQTQMGDLGALAAGDFAPTPEDKQRIAEIMGLTTDIARRDIGALSEEAQARLGETFAARGMQGASFESVDRAILERDLARRGMDITDRARMEANQAMMTMPLQRAGLQIGANQALFQRLAGAANPLLSSALQGRLAQTTMTQQQQGINPMQAIQLGGMLAAPVTGGLSMLPSLFTRQNTAGLPQGGIGFGQRGF